MKATKTLAKISTIIELVEEIDAMLWAEDDCGSYKRPYVSNAPSRGWGR